MIVSLAFSAERIEFFLEVTNTCANPSFSLVEDGEFIADVDLPSWERRFDADIEMRRFTNPASGTSSEASFIFLG